MFGILQHQPLSFSNMLNMVNTKTVNVRLKEVMDATLLKSVSFDLKAMVGK